MGKIQHLINNPAGKVGLTIGLTIGVIAALMGEASQALLFVGFCRFIAGCLGHER
jgi:hypothetical protein